MSSLTVLSFLGTGTYGETTYTWEDRACEARFMPAALQSIFDPDELLVAQTPGAREKHGADLQSACDYTAVGVPRATGESDWWEMFNALAEAVPEDTKLTVDVTHGFRSQPLLALAVVFYLRAVKDVTLERVVYGAFEEGDEGRSPVVDLTSFLDLIDWAQATDQFEKYGDAAPLQDMFQDIAGESRLGDRVALRLKPAGKTLRRLTQALSLNRPMETIEEADGLIEVLDGAMKDAVDVPAAVPVKQLLIQVTERFAPLGHAEGTPFTSRGFTAQAAMLRFYVETEQYLQAFTLAQEILVSWVCVQNDFDPLARGAKKPARKGRKGARALLADWDNLSEQKRKSELGTREQTVARQWEQLREKRNDVAHAGFSHNPRPSKELINDAESLLMDIAEFFDSHQ